MDIKQTDLYWFQLNEEIRVEDVDKFSGNNMHPDRMMTQWVLVLMISGERSFRVYGENYVVHSGEFFLLPPYVQHCGLQYDNHAAYFAHFQATGIQVPPPVKVDTNHILLPLHGQIPLELPCFDLMEYAIQHRTLPFSSKNFLSSQIQAILYQISFEVYRRAAEKSAPALKEKYSDLLHHTPRQHGHSGRRIVLSARRYRHRRHHARAAGFAVQRHFCVKERLHNEC